MTSRIGSTGVAVASAASTPAAITNGASTPKLPTSSGDDQEIRFLELRGIGLQDEMPVRRGNRAVLAEDPSNEVGREGIPAENALASPLDAGVAGVSR
jgi:hypothetical protein